MAAIGKVLIIDDSKAIRFILGKMMRQCGWDVVEAEHGVAALETLSKTSSFQLALVDWNMPVMNGLQFVAEVASKQLAPEMKMMMVTTETEMSQVVRALEAGAHEYIMKPFTKEMILEKISILGLNTGAA